MAFDLSRLRDDQLLRLQEVGGDLTQLTDDELLGLQASQEEISDWQAGRMAAGSALETGVASLLGAFGFDETAQSTQKSAEQTQEELSRRYQRDVPSIVESFETQGVMGGISDLPEFMKETLAFSLPQTGAALAAGAAGTLVGGPLTGLATATAVGTPIFAGYNIQRQMEEQNIGFEDAQVAKAYGVGVGQAALDAVLGRVLGLFGRTQGPEEIAKAAQRGMLNRVARKAGAGVAVEAPTETLQQSLEIIQANPEKFFEFGPEVRAELLESAIAGGLLGGAISAPTGIIRPSDPQKEKEEDLDRHMQEDAEEAAEMQRNAEFLAGETKALGAPMLELPPPAPLTVGPDGEVVVPPESTLRPARGVDQVIRQPAVGEMPEEVVPRLGPPAPVSVTPEGVGIVPPESTLRAQEEKREPIIRQPAIGEMPVEERLALPPAGQVPIQMPAELPEARQPVIRQPRIGDPIEEEAMDLLGLPKPEDVAIELPQGGFREPGVIEITPEGAVTQPSIDLAINPFGDSRVQQAINKIASDEVPQLDTNKLGKVQMNLSDDKFQVYKRRDPGTNAFVYSVTDGQNVVELNRDPFPPAAGMNYTQDIINSTKTGADAVSTLPASNLQEAIDFTKQYWSPQDFKTPTGTTPKQKSKARTELRKALRDLGLTEERIKKIVNASPAGLQAARKYAKKADVENAAKIRENAKKFATDTERSEYNRLAERVRRTLIKRLRALGLKDVALDFENAIIPETGGIAEGYATPMEEGKYTQQNQAGRVLIALSSQIYKPDITEAELTQRLGEVMNHEMIHAIKMMGLFSPDEYATLVKAAKAQSFVDRKGQTRKFSYFERAQRFYGDQNVEIQEEEAVAELFRDWAAGRKKLGGKPVTLFRRIINFLKGIAEDADAEGIFKKIESGEVGARERGPMVEQQGAMYSRKATADSPAFYSATENQIESLVGRYSYPRGTIAYAVRMPIEDFMSLSYAMGEIKKQDVVATAKAFLEEMPSNDASRFMQGVIRGVGPTEEVPSQFFARFDPEKVDSQNYMGIPYLELSIDQDTGAIQVRGHEGRHRTAIAAIDGATTIPVQVVFKDIYSQWDSDRLFGRIPPTQPFDYAELAKPRSVVQQFFNSGLGLKPEEEAYYEARIPEGVPIDYGFKEELDKLIGPQSDPLGITPSEKMYSVRGPRIQKSGEIVGAPPGARTKKDRENLVKRMVRYMESPLAVSEKSKDWYENSGKAIREITRGDPELMDRSARLMALYSQGNSVGGNTTALIKSIYQLASGQDTAFAGRFPETTAARIPELLAAETFDQSVTGVSDKIENFYRNLIDPALGTNTYDQASTMDKWMMRLFGYKVADDEEVGGASALSPTQYAYARDIVDRIGRSWEKKTGEKLLPRQVQAVLWTYVKNKTDLDKIKDPEKKRAFSPKVVDFNDYLVRATANVTWESRPSESVPLLSWIHDAPRNVQEMWNEKVRSILTNEDGSDKIMSLFPSEQLYNSDTSIGAYEGKVTPNIISRIVLRKDKEQYVTDIADKYAALVGYITKQDAVPWYRPDIKGGRMDSVGFDVQFDGELTANQETELIEHLNGLIPGVGYTKIDGSLQFINFRDETGKPEISDKAYEKRLMDALDSFDQDITFTVQPFRAQSNYISNDWEENPNGEGYIETYGGREFADIQQTVDGWANQYVQAAEQFDLRRDELLGTDRPVFREPVGEDRGRGDATRFSRRGYPTYESGRLGPEKGRDSFDGYHYSATDNLDALDSEFHGAGKAGLELKRGWRNRVFFYLQENEEIPRPERQLSRLPNGYGAHLPNIYNPRKDRYIIEEVKANNNGVLNHDTFEDMVISEGYDGYINWGFQPTPAMVLLQKSVVPVKQTMRNRTRFSTKGAFVPSRTYEQIMSRVIYEDTTNPFNKLLGKFVGQVEGETLGQAFVRNTVNRFLPGFILDNIAYGALANDSNSVGKAMELSQQMSGRMEALINLGALKIDPETGDVSMADGADNKGIQDIFAPIGEEKKKAFQMYAVARRETDLRKKNRRGFLNISNADVQKLIDEAPPEFKEVFEEYSTFNRRMVQFAVDSGLITQEMADNLTDMAYVPFYREMEADAVEDLGKAIGKNAGNSLNNPSVFDKKLEGGKIPLGDFYENIIRNNEMILSASLRNVAMRKTADALDRMNRLGITSHGKKLTKKSEGERVLVFRRDGEEQFYQIDDAALWVSIANLTPTQRNAITAFMEIFAGILRSGVTLSPGFMLANLWRGKIDAYVKMGVPLNPITTTIRGMKDAYTGGEASTAIKIRTGIGGYTYGIGQEAFANELRRKYRRKEGGYGPLQRFTDGLSEIKMQLEKVGEATEFAERVAVYDKLIAAGMSEREATYQAMNLINFGRRGAGGGVFGSFVSALVPMIPFLNARIQGLYRLIEDPNQPQDIRVKMTKEVALRGALVGIGSTALYALAMQDDRWDEERLDRKLNYDIIYVGDKTIYLPRAFEIGAIFGSLPMLTLEAIRKEDGKDLAEGTASIFLNTFAFNPIPQGALPLIETAANFDFFRMAPIEGLSLQRLPVELRAYDSTPEIYKQFGEIFGMSPLKAQQVFEGYTGNMGAGLMGFFDTLLGAAGVIPDKPSGVFGDPHSFLGTAASASGITRFISQDGQRSSRFVADFYQIKRDIGEVYYAIQDAAIRGDQEEINRLMEEKGVALQFRKQFNRVATRLTDLNRRMKIISASPNLSSEQKSTQLKVLRDEKNRLSRQMVQAANKAGLY